MKGRDFPHIEPRERLALFEAHLAALYGVPEWHSHAPPLDELICTVLSQHTSDRNTERAFSALRAAYPDWEAVAAAPTAQLADVIRTGGLSNIKAPRVQSILHAVHEELGSYSLDSLTDLSFAAFRRWLVALPGVGPKTASCVMLFSLGLPAMPVDTHVHRVSRRLGLIEQATTADAAHEVLEHAIGPDRDRMYALHMNLIRHGRSVCKARSPNCQSCILVEHCPSASP